MSTLYHSTQHLDPIPSTSGIYRITCVPTGKFYIGSSVNLRKRWNEHRNGLTRQDHGNPKLQRAWNKHGEQAFIFEVLELVLAPFLLEREQHYLDTLKPFSNKGFNIAKASNSTLGRETSLETREKIAAAQRGRKHTDEHIQKASQGRKGRKHTKESRAKMSLSQLGNKKALGNTNRLGKEHSPETRAKMSANSSSKGKPAHNRGTNHTEEAKRKIADSLRGQKHSAETRAKQSTSGKAAKALRMKTIIVTDPSGIEYTVTGIREFCKNHNLDRSTLMRVTKGEASHHKGWLARFPETN